MLPSSRSFLISLLLLCRLYHWHNQYFPSHIESKKKIQKWKDINIIFEHENKLSVKFVPIIKILLLRNKTA
jgi:hypothetical protein